MEHTDAQDRQRIKTLVGMSRTKLILMREHGKHPGHSVSRQMSKIVPGEIASYFCDKCGLRVTPAQLPYLERRDGILPGDITSEDIAETRFPVSFQDSER